MPVTPVLAKEPAVPLTDKEPVVPVHDGPPSDLVNNNVPAGNINAGKTAVCVHTGQPPLNARATAVNNFSTNTELPALLTHDKVPSTNAGLSTTKRNLREPANPELRDES